MADFVSEVGAPFETIEVAAPEEPVRHLVLLTHGILSITDRCEALNRRLPGRFGDVVVTCRPISYGLVWPFQLIRDRWRDKRIALVGHRIQKAIDDEPFDLISIQCHSFGTTVFAGLSQLLQQQFEWVFFAGSICHMNDDMRLQGCRGNVINDCGLRDIWPTIAAAISPKRYGNTGVTGFQNPPVQDRFFSVWSFRRLQHRSYEDMDFTGVAVQYHFEAQHCTGSALVAVRRTAAAMDHNQRGWYLCFFWPSHRCFDRDGGLSCLRDDPRALPCPLSALRPSSKPVSNQVLPIPRGHPCVCRAISCPF